MEFSIKALGPEKHKSACAIVGVAESRKLTAAAEAIDRVAGGALRALTKRGDMDGKLGAIRVLYDVVGCERLVVVGLGKLEEFGPKQFREAVRAAVAAAAETGAAAATLYLLDVPVQRRSMRWKARHAVMMSADAVYRFDRMKSKKADARPLASIELATSGKTSTDAAVGLAEGKAIAAGMELTRDLGNLPGNVCTPTYLADTARRLAQDWKLGIDVLERKDMEKLGMNTLISVTRGSAQPPKLIVLKYSGGSKKDKPICLIGKGITFDTGGISLKPGEGMDEMKFDMSGGGSVLGTMRALAELKLKLNVIGVVAAVENMPDGNASKPGDIVTSMSGQTVEILNTDAEGRLILCDALTYVERFEPQAVIDIATLTGACVIALGHVASGLYSNKDRLATEVLAAGEEAWDRAWHMPLWDDYQEQLKSNFADLANIGGRPAGSVTAACFLSRFAKKFDWAHLDIAGTAWKSGAAKGATGRPVPLLTQFLINRAAQ